LAYLLGWLVLGAMLAAGDRDAHATAEIFCVGSSFALGSALVTTDEGQSVDLDIRILQGTYSITTTDTSLPSHVTIRGGYTDQDCTVRNPNPYSTVIDLGGGSLTLAQPKGLSRAAMTIDGVTIRNGSRVSLRSGTGHDFSNDQGDLTVRNTRFTGLTGEPSKDTVKLTVYTGVGRLENAFAYLGSWSAVIAGGGSESQFNFQVQLPNVASDAAVAFTATDADDNTSELGECFPVAKAVLLDDIFKNGFENP
jgi:hypothetical protein